MIIKYEYAILPNLLNINLDEENAFKNFDFEALSKIFMKTNCSLYAICLLFCISPYLPNNFSHTFCFRCLKL